MPVINNASEHETAASNALPFGPEFVDFKGMELMFGIKRSLAYQLLNDKAIKGVSLRRRGQVRGKRLFFVDSVRDYLRQQMEQEEAA